MGKDDKVTMFMRFLPANGHPKRKGRRPRGAPAERLNMKKIERGGEIADQ